MLARPSRSLSVVMTLAACCFASAAYQAPKAGVSADEALRRAVENEEKLKAAERDYSYRLDILVQTFGEAHSVAAQLHRLSEITYDDRGNRVEKILEYPPNPLTQALELAKPDFKSLAGVDPFFLTPTTLPRYSAKFIELQKLDELNTYAFAIEPSSQRPVFKWPDGEHPFKGRIWIDDQDFQIVKVEGAAVTVKDEYARFPKFEFYREIVEDKYWMPRFLYAEDVLNFKRFDLPIKVKIEYSNYKRVRPRR